jgi:hypothetical protein
VIRVVIKEHGVDPGSGHPGAKFINQYSVLAAVADEDGRHILTINCDGHNPSSGRPQGSLCPVIARRQQQ